MGSLRTSPSRKRGDEFSGPLGTIAGLYETAFDLLASRLINGERRGQPLNIDDAYEAALVILPPKEWQRGRETDTPAMKLAADIVEHKGAGQRRNRNRLAFLAVDQTALDDIPAGG